MRQAAELGGAGGEGQLPHAIEGEMTPAVRLIGRIITAGLLLAVAAGLWQGFSSHGLLNGLVNGLKASEVG
ncbi:MAG: cytochrome C oxidase assembly protein, partial [Acidithiobacillus sp.]|nr:cytochrome C oxidase assembly protein [Acidithiobacillus sp.]